MKNSNEYTRDWNAERNGVPCEPDCMVRAARRSAESSGMPYTLWWDPSRPLALVGQWVSQPTECDKPDGYVVAGRVQPSIEAERARASRNGVAEFVKRWGMREDTGWGRLSWTRDGGGVVYNVSSLSALVRAEKRGDVCRECGWPEQETGKEHSGVPESHYGLCFGCHYWQERVDQVHNPYLIRVEGVAYVIGDERRGGGRFSGFGGRPFTIRRWWVGRDDGSERRRSFPTEEQAQTYLLDHCCPESVRQGLYHLDEEVLTTSNLWHNGPVPERWRDRLPDTAEFVR